MCEFNICVCELEDCKLLLKNPVLMPCCGSTICEEHIKTSLDILTNETTFTCILCSSVNQIPEKGLPFNKLLDKMIKLNLHLKGEHKKAQELYEKLEQIMLDHELGHFPVSPSDFLFDFFSCLRNKIDLHREISIEKIQKRYSELIDQVIFIDF
jgi:hypothetical protein